MVRRRVTRLLAAALLTLAATVTVTVATSGVAHADGCITFPQTLRLGSTGDYVKALQVRVAGWPGNFGEVLSIDGNFGPRTEAAVRRFQSAYGLTVDGVAGPQTFGKIYELQDDDCTPIHFTFGELTQSATCGSQASLTGGNPNDPSVIRGRLIQLMWKLEALRHQLGDRPINLTSGFRSIACNLIVSDSGTNGPHTYGWAADLIGSPTFCQLAQQARYAGFNGIIGPNNPSVDHEDHIHLDSRTSGRYWRANRCGVSNA